MFIFNYIILQWHIIYFCRIILAFLLKGRRLYLQSSVTDIIAPEIIFMMNNRSITCKKKTTSGLQWSHRLSYGYDSSKWPWQALKVGGKPEQAASALHRQGKENMRTVLVLNVTISCSMHSSYFFINKNKRLKWLLLLIRYFI